MIFFSLSRLITTSFPAARGQDLPSLHPRQQLNLLGWASSFYRPPPQSPGPCYSGASSALVQSQLPATPRTREQGKKPRGHCLPAHHSCCVMARGGGDQEGLQALPLRLDEMSHDSFRDRLMSTSCESHCLSQTVEVVSPTKNASLLFQCLIPTSIKRTTFLMKGLLPIYWSVTTTLQRSFPTAQGQPWLPS